MRGLDQFARALFMFRMQKRKQIAYRDRLRAVRNEFPRGTQHRLFLKRNDNLALRRDLLARFLALCAGRQEHRCDRFQHDTMQILAELIPDLQDVAKSLAGDQPDLRAFPFQHRIGGDRRAMQEARDLRRRDIEALRQMRDGVQHRLARIAA